MGESRKVAIITGASQGIGEALVRAYRDRDFRVVANSRLIRPSTDPNILAVAGDITDPATAERIISQAIERFGRVDTLLNNVGIFIGKPFIEYTPKDYASMLAINLSGFFHITQRAIAQMLERRSGHIVQITSSLDENADSRAPSSPKTPRRSLSDSSFSRSQGQKLPSVASVPVVGSSLEADIAALWAEVSHGPASDINLAMVYSNSPLITHHALASVAPGDVGGLPLERRSR